MFLLVLCEVDLTCLSVRGHLDRGAQSPGRKAASSVLAGEPRRPCVYVCLHLLSRADAHACTLCIMDMQ